METTIDEPSWLRTASWIGCPLLGGALGVGVWAMRTVDPAKRASIVDAAAGCFAGLLDAIISRASLDPDLDLAAEQAILRTILIRFLRPVSPPDGP